MSSKADEGIFVKVNDFAKLQKNGTIELSLPFDEKTRIVARALKIDRDRSIDVDFVWYGKNTNIKGQTYFLSYKGRIVKGYITTDEYVYLCEHIDGGELSLNCVSKEN